MTPVLANLTAALSAAILAMWLIHWLDAAYRERQARRERQRMADEIQRRGRGA